MPKVRFSFKVVDACIDARLGNSKLVFAEFPASRFQFRYQLRQQQTSFYNWVTLAPFRHFSSLIYCFGFRILSLLPYRIMADKKRNTWSAKTKRIFTSILPVSKRRKGQCINCGECCKLPNACPFLKYKPDGKSYCSIYTIRPLNCRKYPRTESEFITADTCGHYFE